LAFPVYASRAFAVTISRKVRGPESVQNPPSNTTALIRPRLIWIIFPAILVIYLLFPTKNYYWDGILFARVIESANGLHSTLLHPNHLLYNVLGYFLYKVFHAVGAQWRAIEVLQFANSVASVLTAYLLYRILKRSLQSDYLAWALTLAFALSSTWWKFSTDANAYIFSVFCLLLAFYFTLEEFKPRPLLVALIFSAAALLHQLAVIAYPLLALALFWQASTTSPKRSTFVAAQFCLFSFLLVFTTYYYCFHVVAETWIPAKFVQWVTSYSPDASFSFNFLSNLGYTLRGNVRLFFNARPSLLRGLLSPPIVVTIAVFAVVVLLWLFALIRGTSLRNRAPKNLLPRLFTERLRKLYLIWIGLYIAFLFFWLPHNTFYRLFYLPAIILLIGELLTTRRKEKTTYRLGLFVAVMALSSFLFFIYPNSHVEKYPPLSLALEMNNVWKPGTVVYFYSENYDNNLVAYFNPAIEWRPLRSSDQMSEELKQVYDERKTAWLEASAIDQLRASANGAAWLAQHGRSDTWRERQARGYNVKFIQVGP
jgi:hypothetical protein